ADFCRIWVLKPGDRCAAGCIHACRQRDRCLHLIASSGRYTHIDSPMHGRVPLGADKIGRLGEGIDAKLLTNEAQTDDRIHDRQWAKDLGLTAFSGYQLVSEDRSPIGVLALFSTRALTPGDDVSLQGLADTASQVIQMAAAEEALRASERFLADIFDSIQDGINIIDTDFNVLRTNSETERRFAPALPLVGKKCYTAYHGREKPCEECAALRTMQTGQADLMVETIKGKSGEIAECIEVRSFPLLDPATGKVSGVINYLRDITQQKQAEEALRRSEENLRQSQKMEAVGCLAGGVAHDFNNILTAMEEIHKAAERAASLTRQLLAFSRKQIFAPKELNLNNLIMNLDKMLRRLLSEDLKLVTIAGENLGQVLADPGQIEQVIINLVVNARDAMPRGGVITVETQNICLDTDYTRKYGDLQPGDYVMLAVGDTGSGMDEASRARVFEPFYTTKGLGKGTGLGLSTVHGIVNQSGGHITVYSEVGQGSIFKIYLPRLARSAETEPAAPSICALDQGAETILLVEDEDIVRQVARRILEMQGYTVLEAASGREALLLSQQTQSPIHLMLTDVVMPGMSGGETAERLQAQRPELKVLFMSGHTENSIVHHGVLDPGVAFIQKPFRGALLVHKVRQVLDQPSNVAQTPEKKTATISLPI
ncbi:MAG: response regulator, partial [Deltaproteobacteria bacterium]|nr:response regulator [Deltaproteobacteria bacterium]